MAFSSNTFLFCFLPLMLLVYHSVRRELRGATLLLGSYLFYAWAEPRALAVLLGVTVLSYGAALLLQTMRRKEEKALSHLLLAAAILLDVGLLIYFKYTNFLLDILHSITGKGITLRQTMVPVGVSFFIFQSISYLVDVYRGKTDADKRWDCCKTQALQQSSFLAGFATHPSTLDSLTQGRKYALYYQDPTISWPVFLCANHRSLPPSV